MVEGQERPSQIEAARFPERIGRGSEKGRRSARAARSKTFAVLHVPKASGLLGPTRQSNLVMPRAPYHVRQPCERPGQRAPHPGPTAGGG